MFCLGPVAWIDATFDRGLFRRLTKAVPTDGMQNVETLQPLEPGRERRRWNSCARAPCAGSLDG